MRAKPLRRALLVALSSPLLLASPSQANKGIWMTDAEIMALPMSGTAWDTLTSYANLNLPVTLSSPDISNQDEKTNVFVLAKALVYLRTGRVDTTLRDQVRNNVMRIIGREDRSHDGVNPDDALAISRKLCAYIVAADLVGLTPAQDDTFKTWLGPVRYERMGDGRSLTSTHEERPNNWGTHAGASRAAAAVYLDDVVALDSCARVFKGWLGDTTSYTFATNDFGNDLSWQCDEAHPVGVNPLGCIKWGCCIDGALPEEMRRGASLDTCPYPPGGPTRTIYPWGGLGSALNQAEILRRHGYNTFGWVGNALFRAAQFLRNLDAQYGRWWAEGDDLYAPWLLNSMYGDIFPDSTPAKYGKQMGWTDWTHGPTQEPTPPGAGGGCPVLEVRAAEGWVTENTILGRSKNSAFVVDAYRVKQVPVAIEGRYRLRIRESEQEVTTLDEVRAVAVDHAPGVRAYATEGGIWLGERRPAFRVRTSAGMDITSLVNGSGAGFLGGPGDTLLVEMTEPGTGLGELLGPGIIEEPHGKKLAPPPAMLRPQAGVTGAEIDAWILDRSGILVQARNADGVWTTVQHYYPRESSSEAVIESAGRGQIRLVFVGQHRLPFIGRVAAVEKVEPPDLALLSAKHVRSGDALGAVSGSGGAATAIAPGDVLDLEFAATAVPEGLVRDLFLIARGVYTTQLEAGPGAGQAGVPQQFALAQNQPNPFSRTTTIRFALPQGERVRLEVFDLLGRRIKTLVDGQYPAGVHAADWDRTAQVGGAAKPGVYLYRLIAGYFRDQKKMILLPQ